VETNFSVSPPGNLPTLSSVARFAHYESNDVFAAAETRSRPESRAHWQAERLFKGLLRGYEHSLRRVLQYPGFTIAILLTTIAVNIYLFVIVRKGFFPY
jgi:multidrug efflux pump subunit AcrB